MSLESIRRAGVPALALVSLLAGCRTAGPAYERPAAPAAPAWSTPEPWRPGAPNDAIPKGEWWTIFKDERLNGLETQALHANQQIAVAAAQYDQARALTALALSALYPRVSAAGQVEAQRLSGTRTGADGDAITQVAATLPLTVSYEVDLFGKRLRSIEASQASLEAAAAATENVRLVITAELASDYFTLSRLDAELGILTRTSEAIDRGLQLVRKRHDGGLASGLDVAQEETLLAATRTQAILLRQQRDEFEHAMAVLVGQPAPAFHVDTGSGLADEPPAVDTGLPTDLLERRPDVAEAERQMASANAKIGVARSAYFPSLNLLGGGGWQTASLLKLLDVSSLVWAVGATVAGDLFDGGARKAEVAFAEAGYTAEVARYRDTVLRAFADVEDALGALRVLDEAQAMQAQAVEAATRALTISNTRYVGGLTNLLEVVIAQQAVLNNERLAAQIQSERLVTTVLLIKALGGGWRR